MEPETTPETPDSSHRDAASNSASPVDSTRDDHASGSAASADDIDDGSLSGLAKAKSEYARDARKRERFMAWLGLDDDEAIELYHRMRMSQIPSEHALLGATAEERLTRMKETVEAKLRSLPRFTYPEFRSRLKINQRVKITSELFDVVPNDADELAKMALLSGEMITRMIDKIDEQMALHLQIVDRLEAARRLEEKAIASPPEWTLEIARMIESTGFDRLSIRSKGKDIVRDIRKVLEQHGKSPENASEMFDRLGDRLAANIDREFYDGDLDANSQVPIDEDSETAVMIEGTSDVVPDEWSPSGGSAVSDLSSGRMAEAFFAGDFGAKTATDPKPDEARPDCLAVIAGLEDLIRFDAMYSQFDRREPSPLNNSYMARIEERDRYSMAIATLINGVLPDAAWLRYEAVAGDYALVQMRGPSSILPRLNNAFDLAMPGTGAISGMLPPYASMARYGEIVGATEAELRSLAAWDAAGTGPAHLRPAVLNGTNGDPVQAYEVMKHAVHVHLSKVLGYDEAAQISPLAREHVARFWLFLVLGRMRNPQLDRLWPDGFFHGVEGHDVGLGNHGYLRLLRMNTGSIDASIV
ncbi:hypothetical protein [Erythrobacter neustonensis]|uniref:hypothetical protein n=1 Tax=Erythrobacter neustonensis TaxID=1112 RepID=UPI0012E877F4|nr:hypothetical protein [Erythrobacter neustonensis]